MRKTFDFKCKECGALDVILVENPEEMQPCNDCGEVGMERVWITMPGITRASYIDSQKTARASEMKSLKRAAKLEVEAAGARPEDARAIKREIKELRKAPKK